MEYFLLENKKTGWKGSVSERIYNDRLKNHPDEYFDPRFGDGYSPGTDAPLKREPEQMPEPEADRPAPAASSGWIVEQKEGSKGWYLVLKFGEGGQKILANDGKALRKAAAESLKTKLNG